jgi:hypothetical protein
MSDLLVTKVALLPNDKPVSGRLQRSACEPAIKDVSAAAFGRSGLKVIPKANVASQAKATAAVS